MSTKLGFSPDIGQIVLTEGADFLLDLTLTTGTWPVGTTATIMLLTATPITWAASLSGGSILRWKTEQTGTTAAIVPSGTKFRAIISFPAVGGGTSTEFARYVGVVQRKD